MKKFLLLPIIAASILFSSCHKKPDENKNNSPSLEIKEQKQNSQTSPKPKLKDEKPDISEKSARDAMVGVWVMAGEECDSSTGISLAANGKYASDDEGGTWSMDGYSLKVDAIDAASADSESKTAANEWILKLRKIDDKQAILSRGDGKKVV